MGWEFTEIGLDVDMVLELGITSSLLVTTSSATVSSDTVVLFPELSTVSSLVATSSRMGSSSTPSNRPLS